MCASTHTRTQTACGVIRCEPGDRDETPGEPEESRWTESRHICICMCTKHTCAYIYAEQRDEILDKLLLLTNFPSLKSKRCERNTENSNPRRSELHRLSIKGTELLFKVIKAIIVIDSIEFLVKMSFVVRSWSRNQQLTDLNHKCQL